MRIGRAGCSIGREHGAVGDSAPARRPTRLNAVEINSSRCRPHQHKRSVRRVETVPKDFIFSVKTPPTLTHAARLVKSGPPLDAFPVRPPGLRPKPYCLLLQRRSRRSYDARVAARFFGVLRWRQWAGSFPTIRRLGRPCPMRFILKKCSPCVVRSRSNAALCFARPVQRRSADGANQMAPAGLRPPLCRGLKQRQAACFFDAADLRRVARTPSAN